MKQIKTLDAVGHVLCHDITQILPGEFKGRAFKKGHIVREEDIEKLLSLGKDHLYVWENQENMVHENEGAVFLKDLSAGENLEFGEIKEGKIDYYASCDGLLKINKELLLKLNSLGEMILATLHNNQIVKKGEKVAATRIIPLLIEKEKLEKAKEIIGEEKIVSIAKIKSRKIGIVTTGNEVYHKRIVDKFGPVMIEKAGEYNCEVLGQTICPDNLESIKNAIEKFLNSGAELIICTGGMSVDPDDLTPTAIKNTNANIVSYGVPILPGAMFLLAYTEKNIPIVGVPGCAMYAKRTVLDLILPRLLANEILTKEDIASYGHGGLCMNCELCKFPNCSFGKGV